MTQRVFFEHRFAPRVPVAGGGFDPLWPLPEGISFRIDDMRWPPDSGPSPGLRGKLRIEIETPTGWRLATREEKDMSDADAPRHFRWVWDE